MKVFSDTDPSNVRKAIKRKYKSGKPPKFRAFPTSKNTQGHEKAFETEDDLAYFLIKNPTWKVCVRGQKDEKDRHIKKGLKIEGIIDVSRLR